MTVIPVYNIILLPDVVFYFKKDIYKNIPEEKLQPGSEILFLMLKQEEVEGSLSLEDIVPVAVKGVIEKIDEEGSLQIRTVERSTVLEVSRENGLLAAEGEERPDVEDISEEELRQRFERLRASLLQFVQKFPWGVWARSYVLHWRNMHEMICAISNLLDLTVEEKYAFLGTDSRSERCALIEQTVHEFIERTEVTEEAQNAEKDRHEKMYREAAIKKQIDYLQKQLDEMHPENVSDVRSFEIKIEQSGMNETAKLEAQKVLNRMKQEGQDGHEYGMLHDYLDFVTSLSWKKEEFKEIDLAEAEKILDEDHFGLKKVKERIIQQLAVMALNKKQAGSILLFVGAPGTGKTSIGQSIAKALGRKYVRISLGGVRDEAEIRGHRRTYIGAMPGRIMEGMKRSGVSNPVVILDEVDKLSRDYSGDPASALLEVLDPEQNNNFTDHYMNVPYDLSDVLFVCTANSADTIPEPLLNRMEVIHFSGYTAVEKFHIAKRHLLPRAMESTGIRPTDLKVTDKAIQKAIEEYTMEAGVRGLKKQMDVLCRAAAVRIVKGDGKMLTVNARSLPDYLGKKPSSHERKLKEAVPGVVTGLAWTQAGGEILFIETKLLKGSGKLTITGQLGDVMKESAQIALSVVKDLYPDACGKLKDHDIHIHVPAGAVPKDGPSAGITLVTALASLMTDRPVSTEYAMTGEVSLRGCVMPIGGLPEKLMAAQRAGISKVLIPAENKNELDDIPSEVTDKLEIIPVKKVSEVLKLLL